jgi:nitrile hydratase
MGTVEGAHDLGGRQGFGPVEIEPDEPYFHEPWERKVLGMAFSAFASGIANGGEFRHSIERMDAAHYLTSSYYEHWLTGLATLLVDKGKLRADDLEARAGATFPLSRPVSDKVRVEVGDDRNEPRFAPGDRVRVVDRIFSGHTRCPGFLRGRRGVVVTFDGVFSVPDVEAHSSERRREATYAVRFDAEQLWPGEAEAQTSVTVGLWDSYLEEA